MDSLQDLTARHTSEDGELDAEGLMHEMTAALKGMNVPPEAVATAIDSSDLYGLQLLAEMTLDEEQLLEFQMKTELRATSVAYDYTYQWRLAQLGGGLVVPK